MSNHSQRRLSDDALELRREAGRWLKQRREEVGLSQRELAALVGAEYYTFVSQLESGRGRVPPERYRAWATALQMQPRDFVRTILRYYDILTYEILFEDEEVQATAPHAGRV
ncbi:helix-turn-helix domain-containing protein [Pseudochelatococcus contaminans]|uniref:Transcriptional regulator with XRE-family HTH domain n=1 Tax=Pseudochelatococcus contaminans TaxID=1538103 RepID=A0A7W5Z2V3_9HYPH|nr:helix-turn-helix transcriptional regulator [Pseudochelatococcus contaminans]MBB3809095.1 transcriptional regulator with XRE-family HTH domain [Pseudochelatococcus contaminans]